MKIKAHATINNVNLRSEKAGDDTGEPACTISFVAIFDRQSATPFFSSRKSFEAVMGHLWNADGDLLSGDIKAVPLSTGIDDGDLKIETGLGEKVKFRRAVLKDVVLTPLEGAQVRAEFKINTYPTQATLWFLACNTRKVVDIICESTQPELNGMDPDDGAEDDEQQGADDGDDQSVLDLVNDDEGDGEGAEDPGYPDDDPLAGIEDDEEDDAREPAGMAVE